MCYATKEIERYRSLISSEPTGVQVKNYRISLRLQNIGDQTKTDEKSFIGNKLFSQSEALGAIFGEI